MSNESTKYVAIENDVNPCVSRLTFNTASGTGALIKDATDASVCSFSVLQTPSYFEGKVLQ
jgi:hypothetical protein